LNGDVHDAPLRRDALSPTWTPTALNDGEYFPTPYGE